jgi:hypothetical protein
LRGHNVHPSIQDVARFVYQETLGDEVSFQRLVEAPDVDESEIERRKELLQLYRNGEVREPIEFTAYSMKRLR